jgi:GNAT superfamily N-acetyltransferase
MTEHCHPLLQPADHLPKQPDPGFSVRSLRDDEAEIGCALVRDVFERYLAAGQSPEARKLFYSFVQPAALLTRHRLNYTSWAAVSGQQLVGLLHIHARNHIALLFVSQESQRRGCARQLLRTTFQNGELRAPTTVNSGPEAVGFYSRNGFIADGPMISKYGVVHQPMRLAAIPSDMAR